MAVEEDRVVAHFDIDCFYAQSEELRCPSLKGLPVGVTQKFLVVTSNYKARELGVPKMVSIVDAKQVLPSLVLINGEDLTPYRADSKRVMAVLRRFGTLERHGFDEGAVDITSEVLRRFQSGNLPGITFQGHVLGLPGMNLGNGKGTWIDFGTVGFALEGLSSKEIQVLVGGQIVSEMRAVLENETGFRCSCGVAGNKMLAKLASSLNKPSKQTCLLDGAVAVFLAPMSVRKIQGVGKQIEGGLLELGVETMADLGKVTIDQLCEKFGTRIGTFLFQAGMGRDPTPVLDKGPPKTISVEDSFRNCKTMQRASEILRGLAPDLIRRLDEDKAETGRKPKTLTLKWRANGSTWNFSSTSQKTPPEVLCSSVAVEKRAVALADIMAKLFVRTVKAPFDIVVLNIGATNFVDGSSADLSPGGRDIRSFLNGTKESPVKDVKFVSKMDARVQRESFKPMVVRGSLEPGGFFAVPKRKLTDLSDMSMLSEEENDFYPSNCSSENEAEEGQELLDHFGLSSGQEERRRMKAVTLGVNRDGIPNSLKELLSSSGLNSLTPDAILGVHKTPSDWAASTSADLDGGLGVGSGILLKTESSFTETRFGVSQMANGAITLSEEKGVSPRLQNECLSLLAPGSDPLVLLATSSKSPFDANMEERRGIDTSSPAILQSDKMSRRSSMTGGFANNPCSAQERLGVNECRLQMKCDNDRDVSVDDMGTIQNLGAVEAGACWACEKCGKLLEQTPNARQEHSDYHFAMTLDNPPEWSSWPRKAVPFARKGQATGQKSEPRFRSGTLDRFVIRHS